MIFQLQIKWNRILNRDLVGCFTRVMNSVLQFWHWSTSIIFTSIYTILRVSVHSLFWMHLLELSHIKMYSDYFRLETHSFSTQKKCLSAKIFINKLCRRQQGGGTCRCPLQILWISMYRCTNTDVKSKFSDLVVCMLRYASKAKLESKMYKQHLIWFPANFDWYVEVSSTIFWLW